MLNEDKLKITITAILFMLVSFFVILTFNVFKQKSSETTDPKVFDGVLDLRAWDFERKGPAALSGKWEFYWHSLLQPDDFTTLSGTQILSISDCQKLSFLFGHPMFCFDTTT
jgi:hypothetical protein